MGKILLKYLLINILFAVVWTTICLILLGPATSSIFKIAHVLGAIIFGVGYAVPSMSLQMNQIMQKKYIKKLKDEVEKDLDSKDE